MPSPLGHALASAVLYKRKIRGKWTKDWKLLIFYIFCGICPDLDFLPGFFMGDVNRFHHGFSHSFLGAFVIAGFLWLFYGIWRHAWKIRDLFFISVLVILHPVMDFFALDTSFPYGCPLFYPFSKAYWISPWIFFQDIHRSSLADFFFGANNLLAFWIECAVFLPLLMVATLSGSKRLWLLGVAGLVSLGVILYFLREVRITQEGIEFVRILF